MSGRLAIEHPASYPAERAYIFDVVLGDFLGLDYRTEAADRSDVRVTVDGDPLGRELRVADCLFSTPADQWLTPASLPRRPLAWWDRPASVVETEVALPARLPVIYGEAGHGLWLRERESAINLGVDLFGGAFFMLTRYEEMVTTERDAHGRFPAAASLAGQEGFLDRPVVNEYVEILWGLLRRLWPRLERRRRAFRVLLSHDVDWPLCTAGKTRLQALRTVAADVLKRNDPLLALRRGRAVALLGGGNGECVDCDPCNTFDFIMDLSERHGLRSAFYFIAGHSAGSIDGNYCLDDPWIRGLIERLHWRGHEIGLHPSYNTYHDAALTSREADRLRRVLTELGIEQERLGGRQHYLRWENPVTWRNWAEAGLDYDSTVGFADHAGFRCGTCYSYPVFDLEARQRLALREYPLIVMEVSVFGYMGLTGDDALATITDLARACRQFGGDFTLLWHNNNLVSRAEQRCYRAVVETVAC